jgi:hypothetical protein
MLSYEKRFAHRFTTVVSCFPSLTEQIMRILWSCAALALFGLMAPANRALAAAAPPKDAKKAKAGSKSYEVPYKTTIPKHIVVRVKINGKGPFNLILDTGAPMLFVSVAAGKKAGVKADEHGWATFDRFELEGGLVMKKAKGRVETPFQLEGMNGLGLAGMEIHGLIGYSILAQYRIEIDFARDKMVWTPLDYKLDVAFGGKPRGGQPGGLELLGSIMKTAGAFLGRKPAPEVILRGFFGLTLKDGDSSPVVDGVLEKGPAGAAGIQKGDVVTHIQGRSVTNVADLVRLTHKLPAGSAIKLTVKRGTETKSITFKSGEGI